VNTKKRFAVLGTAAVAALISIPAATGTASASSAPGHATSATRSVASVRQDATAHGLTAVPVAGAAETKTTHGGLLTTTSLSASRGAKAATASAAFVRSGPFYLYNNDTGKCLDADLGTINRDGTVVQLWNCISGNRNQWWYEDNYGSYARFWNVYSGRYLDADANNLGRNGTVVQLWDFIANNTNQWWSVNSNGTITNEDGAAGIHAYLDADTNTMNNPSTRVQLWQFVGGSNQYWHS
jgi:hypothetical protein